MPDRDLLQRFLAEPPPDDIPYLLVDQDGALTVGAALGAVALMPGSFNPLHDGHTTLAAVAAELLAREVVFELSVTNVDKPPLTEPEVRRRIAQFAGRSRVALTRATRFVEKARLFPGCVFVVGYDTFARIIEARYYGGDSDALHAALDEMHALGCRFLVGGRALDGTFRTIADADIPPAFTSLFEQIPPSRFRVDISSTALRGD